MPLNKIEIDRLLKREEFLYIATVKLGGRPHIAPIWFVYHKGKIYFETDKDTVKFKNITKKNRIAICFSGKEAYLIEGKVKWWTEEKAPISFRKLFWKKYKDDMEDSFITKNTLIFEVIPEKEISWHYAPTWD